MTTQEIKAKLQTKEYDFLRTHPNLQHGFLFITVGGSHAYGTNIETSDLDIRGAAFDSSWNLLTNQRFDQVEDHITDTVIYSLEKLISLLSNCNPNVIELLGCRSDQYFELSETGKLLLDSADMFLSKKAIQSFGGYATQQLRRLENKANLSVGQAENERHILETIQNAQYAYKEHYMDHPQDAIRLYLDDAIQDGFDKEIFMDITLRHYPLRDYKSMWSDMQNIVKDYAKVGKRNQHAITHGKIAKHMMHLIRLYCMCLDILNDHQIITYREKEHDLLMSIRNGDYLDDNDQPTKEFTRLLDHYEKEFERAKEHTTLPEKPDYERIQKFLYDTNLRQILASV